MHHFTALVTLAAVLFYFFTSTRVARARVAYGVKLPAISGNPDFERVFRVQMNTLEWLPIFLPSLWLCRCSGHHQLASADDDGASRPRRRFGRPAFASGSANGAASALRRSEAPHQRLHSPLLSTQPSGVRATATTSKYRR
jgi:hypothetical protein